MTAKVARYSFVAGLVSLALVSFALPMALAAPDAADSGGQIRLLNPLGSNATIPSVLKRIFNEAAIILAFVIPIIIIIGAFQMMFAAGDPEKFATGRKTIVYAVIGYVIILMANGIIAIVIKILTPTS